MKSLVPALVIAPRARVRACAPGLALIGALACSLVCSLLVGCSAPAQQHIPPHATHAASPGVSPAASSSPTTSATPIATATDIPLAVLTGATLGGTTTGFTAIFGAPSGSNQWDAHGITLSVTLVTGTDGLPHVASLDARQSDGIAWTQAQAHQACSALLPPDAVHQRDTTTASGDQEAIYLSGQLASTFLPSAFGDNLSGTLAIDYVPSAGGIARCSVETGTA